MKFRGDSWGAQFPEETLWEIYYRIKAMRWFDAQDLLVREYDCERPPGRNAIFDFKKAMRGEESAHRLSEVATAQAEAAALAKGASVSDEELEAAYKQMACELALRTNSAKEAKDFMEMANAIADRRLAAQANALKAAAQRTKEDSLALSREKFEAAEKRLAAVQGAASDTSLTDEQRVAKIKAIFGMG